MPKPLRHQIVGSVLLSGMMGMVSALAAESVRIAT